MISIGIHKFSNVLGFHPRNISGYVADFNAKYGNSIMTDTGGVIEWNNSAQLTPTEFNGLKASSLDGSTQYWQIALPSELVTNGNFETFPSWSSGNTTSFAQDTETGKQGSYCAKWVFGVSGNLTIELASTLVVGQKYKVKMYYKSTTDIVFQSSFTTVYTLKATSEWNYISFIFTAVGTTARFYSATVAGTAFFDNVSMVLDQGFDLNKDQEQILHSKNWDFERTLGTELASGTVTIGSKYVVTAGTVEGNPVGTEFLAVTNATTLDANNKVREIPNLITNGTFDTTDNWSPGAGWSIDTVNKKAVSSGTSGINITHTVINFKSNKRYRISFQVLARTSGEVFPRIVDSVASTADGTPVNTTGTFSWDITAGANATGLLSIRGTNNFVGEIDNVHAYEIPEWTASGNHTSDISTLDKSGTGATNTQSLKVTASGAGRGAERITVQANIEFSSDTGFWTRESGWSISGGTANCDGTNASNLKESTVVVEAGKKYEITYTVKNYVGGSVRFQVTGGLGTYRSANGTYTEQVTVGAGTYFSFYSSNFNGSIDDVSVKEVLGEVSLPSANLESCVEGKKYTIQGEARLDASSLTYGSDLTSGWDFTNWSPQSGVTINDLNTFTTTGTSAGIFKALCTVGKVYKLIVNATSSTYNIVIHNGTSSETRQTLTSNLPKGVSTTYYFIATFTEILIQSANVDTVDVTTFELYQADMVNITAQLGTKSVTSSALSITAGTFTKFVLNFEATSGEVNQDLKLWLSGAGSVFVDKLSLTQAYDYVVSNNTKAADNGALQYIISSRDATAFSWMIRKQTTSKLFDLYLSDDKTAYQINATSTKTENSWNSIRTIFNRTGSMSIFVNSDVTSSTSISLIGKHINNASLIIGQLYTNTNRLNGQISYLQIIRFENISQSTFNSTITGLQYPTGGGAEEVLRLTWDNVVGSVAYDASTKGNNATAYSNAQNDIITIKDYSQTLKLRQATKANRPAFTNNEVVFTSANADNLVNSATLGNCKTIVIKAKISSAASNKIVISFEATKYLVVVNTDLTPSNITYEAYDTSLNVLPVGINGPNSRVVTVGEYFIAVIKQSTAIDCSSISFINGSYPMNGSIQNLAFFSTELSDADVLKVLNYMR